MQQENPGQIFWYFQRCLVRKRCWIGQWINCKREEKNAPSDCVSVYLGKDRRRLENENKSAVILNGEKILFEQKKYGDFGILKKEFQSTRI